MKYILFDFDGVIADSFYSALEVKQMICPHVTEEEYRKLFEGNINDTMNSAASHTEACRNDIDFMTEFSNRMENTVQLFSGMKEVVNELSTKYILVIISSTTTVPIQKFLKANNLNTNFAWIMGNDVHKSKVEKIKMVFSKYSINADDCVFITDTLGDIHEAGKMGVKAIAVDWGYGTLESLHKGNPYSLVNNPNALLATIQNSFSL